jgi:hypothetical protein
VGPQHGGKKSPRGDRIHRAIQWPSTVGSICTTKQDWHLVDHVVWQILVQVAQGVWILAEGLVLAAEAVTGRDATEFDQVHNVECANVVWAT